MDNAQSIPTADNSQEIWKAIPDFPGYEVSNHGRVRSYWKCGGSHERVMFDTPKRILTPSLLANGFLKVSLCRDGKAYNKNIHRLVLETFIGPCPPGLEACHNNGKATDNHLTNLRWDDHQSNMDDCRAHNTVPEGERNAHAKLTNEQVIEIRRLHAQGMLHRDIGKIYSMSRTNITNIVNGKIWRHLL